MAERKKLHKFEQLEEIRDGAMLTRVLKKYLDAKLDDGLTISQAALLHVDAKRGKACKLMIKAKITDGKEIIGEQKYFGGLITSSKYSPEEYYYSITQRHTNVVDPAYGPPSMFVREWGLLLWAYPNDPNLPGLGLFENRETLLARMTERPEVFGLPTDGYKPVSATVKLTKYVPGMRCGAIVAVEGQKDGETLRHELFGKAYSKGGGRDAYKIMRSIWDENIAQNAGLRVVEPFGFDEEYGVVWQSAVDGKPPIKSASRLKCLDEIAQKIGESLAAYHALDMQLPKTMQAAELLEEVEQACSAIEKTFPAYADQVESLRKKLLENPPIDFEKTPIHMSFKLSHILEDDNEMTIIDFDGARMGDPAYDLGRFNAQILRLKAEKKTSSEMAKKTITRFIQGYNEKARKPIAPERIAWSTANHLVASQAFKTVKRKKEKALVGLLALADEALHELAGE